MNDSRSILIWLGRVLANALAGGLAFAFAGAFCGAMTGFLLGLSSHGSFGDAFGTAYFGALVGVACGSIGFFIHLLPALFAPPDEFWKPFFDLTPRVAWGQFWGTLIAVTAFFAFERVDSIIHGVSFAKTFQEDGIYIVLFAPILMICGAIADAIFKRD